MKQGVDERAYAKARQKADVIEAREADGNMHACVERCDETGHRWRNAACPLSPG